MYSDLVHAASEGPAEDHTGAPVAGESLELRVTVLARAGHPAHSDLVADHLQTLPALDDSPAVNTGLSADMVRLTLGSLPPPGRCTPSSLASS